MATLEMILVPFTSVKSEGVSDSVLSGVTYGTAMVGNSCTLSYD